MEDQIRSTNSGWALKAEEVLNQAESTWSDLGPEQALLALNVRLNDLRRASGESWRRDVVPAVRNHVVTHRIRQWSPIVQHASSWPRGYPGDAGLIDLFYEANADSAQLSHEHRRANATVRQSQTARSVRHRRLVIADAIDQCAAHTPQADILSVACGHARELEWSLAMADGLVNRFVAADQDETSLEMVADRYAETFPAVQPLKLSVRGILSGRASALGQFHLVYAAGLYDYLKDDLARALTTRMFQLLNPGGRLLIGNFSRAPMDIGFMESIMDWPLIWRTESDLANLAAGIPIDEIASIAVWPDATGACLYLDIARV